MDSASVNCELRIFKLNILIQIMLWLTMDFKIVCRKPECSTKRDKTSGWNYE